MLAGSRKSLEEGCLGYHGPLNKIDKRVLLPIQAEREMESSELKIERGWKAPLLIFQATVSFYSTQLVICESFKTIS